MTQIQPNTQSLYPCPTNYIDMFIFGGRRYFKTHIMCLVSNYGSHGFLPPLGRGFYLKIAVKDYKEVKKQYDVAKKEYDDSLMGNLNKGVNLTLF